MKRRGIILLTLFLLMLAWTLSACGKYSNAAWTKNNDSKNGLYRHVVVINSRTGETVYEYTGDCFIYDESEIGNISLVVGDSDALRKIDLIGADLALIAEELPEREAGNVPIEVHEG